MEWTRAAKLQNCSGGEATDLQWRGDGERREATDLQWRRGNGGRRREARDLQGHRMGKSGAANGGGGGEHSVLNIWTQNFDFAAKHSVLGMSEYIRALRTEFCIEVIQKNQTFWRKKR